MPPPHRPRPPLSSALAVRAVFLAFAAGCARESIPSDEVDTAGLHVRVECVTTPDDTQIWVRMRAHDAFVLVDVELTDGDVLLGGLDGEFTTLHAGAGPRAGPGEPALWYGARLARRAARSPCTVRLMRADKVSWSAESFEGVNFLLNAPRADESWSRGSQPLDIAWTPGDRGARVEASLTGECIVPWAYGETETTGTLRVAPGTVEARPGTPSTCAATLRLDRGYVSSGADELVASFSFLRALRREATVQATP